MKLFYLILASSMHPWASVEQTILDTWLKEKGDSQAYFYYGEGHNCHDNKRIYLNTPEGLYNVALKTINALEYVYNNFDFDVLFRTNISSYVDCNLLQKELESLYSDGMYAGLIGRHGDINFASGAGFALDRTYIKELIENKNQLDYNLIDDVCIGKYLTSKNVVIKPLKRCDIDEDTKDIDISHYHYRCKPRNGLYENFVPSTFKKIHKLKGY